jgi:hypothetical protein
VGSSTSVYRIILFLLVTGLIALSVHRLLLPYAGTLIGRVAATVAASVAVLSVLIWFRHPVNRLFDAVPPAVQALAGVGWLLLAKASALLVRNKLRPSAQSRRAWWWCMWAPAGLLLLDALAVPAHATVLELPYIARPTVLASGTALLAYAFFLARPHPNSQQPQSPTWMRTLAVVLVGLLVAAGIFAATDEYAEAVGTDEAELTVARLDGRRGVVVYSERDLGFPPSVSCSPLAGRDVVYRYRCEGLRLFVRTPSAVLALPSTWSRDDGIDGNDRIIVLRDDPSIRLELAPGESDFPYQPR